MGPCGTPCRERVREGEREGWMEKENLLSADLTHFHHHKHGSGDPPKLDKRLQRDMYTIR